MRDSHQQQHHRREAVYYRDTVSGLQNYAPLEGDKQVDVCVIGGGLAGINTALGLVERGREVIVLEGSQLGDAASGRNGGFVAKGYSAGEVSLAKKLGEERASKLFAMTKQARSLIRRRINDFNIDCGPNHEGVLTVSWKDRAADMRATVKMMNERFNSGLSFWPREQVREHCKTDLYFDGIFSGEDFQFHPLSYLHGLARQTTHKGGTIFEQSRATSITREDNKNGRKWRVRTAHGSVLANHVVLCCSIDVGDLDKKLAAASFMVRTYVMVTNPLSDDLLAQSVNTNHAVYDFRFASDYYRRLSDGRILWGGRVGVGTEPTDIAPMMIRDMLKVYPQLTGHVRADYAWSGKLCYAPHKMPQIGKLDDGYWYCTCFGGHGLAPTTIGGEIIAAAIAENSREFELFKPFGLSYAGGKLGPYVAQMVYFWWRARDILGI